VIDVVECVAIVINAIFEGDLSCAQTFEEEFLAVHVAVCCRQLEGVGGSQGGFNALEG
jgi:hypothetical protein